MIKEKQYALSIEHRRSLLNDWNTGKYTQEQLAEKYIISRATVQRYIHGWSRAKTNIVREKVTA